MRQSLDRARELFAFGVAHQFRQRIRGLCIRHALEQYARLRFLACEIIETQDKGALRADEEISQFLLVKPHCLADLLFGRWPTETLLQPVAGPLQ